MFYSLFQIFSHINMADEVELVIPGENKKIETKEDVEYIIEQIQNCPGLTVLRLSGNSYGIEAAIAIGDTLSAVPTLRRALWSDMFVSRLKTEIPPALTSLGNGLITAGARLVELDLSDNAFGPAGVEGVASLLTSEVCYSLKVLKFNNNGLGIGGGKILAKALLTCYEQANEAGAKFSLQVFQSGRNRLENEGAISLSKVFEAIGSLVELSLPQNGIYHEGITSLASSLGRNPNLRTINLSDNTFGEEGSYTISQILPSLQNLEIINFGECLVRSDGAIAIAAALNDSHLSLKELYLSYNELNPAAGIAVVKAMSNKDQLTTLNLNGNNFGEEGIENIQGILISSGGKLDVLQSLSDDEGDDAIDQSTFEDWLENPCKKAFVEMGENQIELLQNYLTLTPTIDMLTDIFIKVTVDYEVPPTDDEYNEAVHEFIDVCCQPVIETRPVLFINSVLSYVGLIKHEDKKFVPTDKYSGPLLAMVYYISKQSYFTRECQDILIAIISKPCSIEGFLNLRPILLKPLY